MANFLADGLQKVYLMSAIPLLIFTSAIHPALTLSGRLSADSAFLPLMMTSAWCSLGLWMAWVRLLSTLFTERKGPEVKVE